MIDLSALCSTHIGNQDGVDNSPCVDAEAVKGRTGSKE